MSTFEKIPVTTHYLSMIDAPQQFDVLPVGIACTVWETPPTNDYLNLYREVGEPWGWSGRLLMSESEVAATLRSTQVKIYRLMHNSTVLGFFDLLVDDSGDVEIVYLGLLPAYIGKGYGRLLLSEAVRVAWQHTSSKVWLHTCNFDHPKALEAYRKVGFTLSSTQEEMQYYPHGFVPREGEAPVL